MAGACALGVALAAIVLIAGGAAQAGTITMASTTSTEQSGLFAHLLPAFKQATGIDVKVVAVGTGQAIDMARRGDADVLFVHDQAAEEKFVAEGCAAKRYPVMYNDFVLVGPKGDPAGVARQGHRRGAEEDRCRQRAASSRAATRAARMPPKLRYWAQAGPGRTQEGQRLQGVRLRHGPGAEHRRRRPTPTC